MISTPQATPAPTLTIIGYENDDVCSHCGRRLVHAINTAEAGILGASCFVKMITVDRKRFSGNGRPTPSFIVELAKWQQFASESRRVRAGYRPHHFQFLRVQ